MPPGEDSKNDLAFLPEETAMGPDPISGMRLTAARSQRSSKKSIEINAAQYGTRPQDALVHPLFPQLARTLRPPTSSKRKQKVASRPSKSQRKAFKPSNIGRQPFGTYEGHGESTTPLRSRYIQGYMHHVCPGRLSSFQAWYIVLTINGQLILFFLLLIPRSTKRAQAISADIVATANPELFPRSFPETQRYQVRPKIPQPANVAKRQRRERGD